MEIWKEIKGYKGLYEASSLGRVKVLARTSRQKQGRTQTFKERILKPINQSNGYLKVNLVKDGVQKTCLIHRVVASTFIEGDNSLTVNHKNGIKTDNRFENLEWVSLSENHKHAFRTGLKSLRGEKSNSNKLTEKQVYEIRDLILSGITHQRISEMYGVKRQTITDINLKRRWNHI